MSQDQPSASKWLDGDFLIVDDDDIFRSSVSLVLRQAGLNGYTAESYPEAAVRLGQHPTIRFAVIDHPSTDGTFEQHINALRQARPDILLIGNSGSDRRQEFAAVAVERYLQKPWSVPQLWELLADKLKRCVDCGLSLPLRFAGPGEARGKWACAACGSRYAGVIDSTASDDLLNNVRSVG